MAPRVSAAWNPAFHNGLFGHLFGDRKTVLRGGYGIAYDRVNTVQSVIIPMLGVGFAQTINLKQPSCLASGTPGANCNIAAGAAGSVFRTSGPIRPSAKDRQESRNNCSSSDNVVKGVFIN